MRVYVYLNGCYSKSHPPAIDYEQLATPFAYSYFLEKFWKAECAFLREPSTPARRVIDVSCGSSAPPVASGNLERRCCSSCLIDITFPIATDYFVVSVCGCAFGWWL